MSEFLWVEKYRPKKIRDCILPEDTKKTFSEFLKQKQIPNLLLSGTAGTGKTTVAKALCGGPSQGLLPDARKKTTVQYPEFASVAHLADNYR